MYIMFFSQYGQDEYLHTNVFKGYKNGFFMDVGANDGVYINNTLFFQREHGWKGVNIEPLPEVYEKLKINRPNDLNINCAICQTDGTSKFLCNNGWTEPISGLQHTYHQEHLKRLIHENKQHNCVTKIIDVATRRIDSICDEHNINHIHYLSIDVEGAEYEVIQSIDFEKVFIDVIGFENNYNDICTENIKSFLTKLGYVFIHEHLDIFMIHKHSQFYDDKLLSK